METVSSKRKRTRMGEALSTIRSAVEGRPSQEPDPELGVGGTPARATAAQSGYPDLATLLDSDECFMICRKFALLQTQVLLHQQDEIMRPECKFDADGDQYLSQEPSQISSSSSYETKLLEIIEEKLSAYSE